MARKIDPLFSGRLAALAGDVNFACNTGQKQAALNAMVIDFNNGKVLPSNKQNYFAVRPIISIK